MIRIPSRRELLLGLGVTALSSAFIGIPGPAVAAPAAVEAPGVAHPGAPRTAWEIPWGIVSGTTSGSVPAAGPLPR